MRARLFPVTIFLSAFLLFQVQPILGRYVLPWFGGTPSVWTTCLLFFQAALLAGYLYAHWLGSRPSLRFQGTVHAALLIVSLALLPIIPNVAFWKPSAGQEPVAGILKMLAATAGGPYFLLASTAPLLQRWFSAATPKAPWRLYSLSNLGSFLALLSYPFVIEPVLRLRVQSWVWSGLYVLFAGLCGAVAWQMRSVAMPQSADAPVEDDGPTLWTVLFWLALSATGAALLMAVTSEISQEVAVSPFLWIGPLAIYLLTFVLTFDSEVWYRRTLFAVLAGVLAPVACAITNVATGISLWTQAGVYLAALFAACMVCHGELVWARPSPRHLTAFYLCVAAGGVAGGLFTAIIAPRSFTEYSEFPIAFAAACLLGFLGWLRSGAFAEWTSRNIGIRISLMALLLGGVSSIVTTSGYRPPVFAVRNFYGILRIIEPATNDPGNKQRQLTHGRIKHGLQFLGDEKRLLPTSYYGPHTGVGVALQAMPSPRRIAVVGLGAGTIAAWGREGDTIRFYEINPAVETIARTWFTYLKDSKAKVDVALGDARVVLERELAAGAHHDYDLMAIDAFSSDSIPLHLLTAEFADLCRERLAPGGVLLFHISNRTLNLEPVVRALGEHLGWKAAMFVNAQDDATGEDGARWVLLTSDAAFLQREGVAQSAMGWTMPEPAPILWTDDFASLWHVFKK